MAFGRLSFLSGILSGTSLHRRSDSLKGSFCTRATSLMAILVAIVPYVMMCATFSCPYFSVTQRSTSPRPSSSKSTSISGKEIRSGFRKRSNSKVVLNRVYFRDAQAIGHRRTGSRSTSRSYRNAQLFAGGT